MILLQEEDPDSLWYNHGIIPDFEVRPYKIYVRHNLTSVPQPFMMRFPRADIYELLTADLLHQAIKGAFKDHFVQWVEDYLKEIYGSSRAEAILDEIDRRYVKSQI
jgi:hypothetical protein